MFTELDSGRIEETAVRLRSRIEERFPNSSLGRVADELVDVVRGASALSAWLAAPLFWLRLGVVAIVLALFLVVAGTLAFSHVDFEDSIGFWESAQGVEAAINDLIFLGVAVYFLMGLERRTKRRRAQRALHVLRSLAHVVDMHQLTKDPERIGGAVLDTRSSPERRMTPFELTRYLDYSSEMLALISKVAVLYVQRFDDAETLETASDVEDLTIGLSRNIWQKIVILDRVLAEPAEPAAPAEGADLTHPAPEGKGEGESTDARTRDLGAAYEDVE